MHLQSTDGASIFLTFTDNGCSAGQSVRISGARRETGGAGDGGGIAEPWGSGELASRPESLLLELCDPKRLSPSVRPHVHSANPAFI